MNGTIRKGLLAALFLTGGFVAGSMMQSREPITTTHLTSGEILLGLEFTATERDSMIEGLEEQRADFSGIRSIDLANDTPPSLIFNPLHPGWKPQKRPAGFKQSRVDEIPVPENLEDLAFASVGQLGALIKSRRITSTGLTRMYLDRLKRYGPQLECVITLTEDLALEEAKTADEEIAAGRYRGPLHGIPYGAKDLLDTRGIRTTWGSAIFKERIPDDDATVIKKLRDAGAVLVAKLTLGELAWGDVWYGGMTRNPWNITQGSSGSSAGSASATAAGLVGFAIGSETWGSIISPSTRCGVTGLRPTFGRVSRAGAMALSWSMDKIGPICRTVEDCAIVLEAIHGPDPNDSATLDVPFSYSPDLDIRRLRIGYLKTDFDSVKDKRNNDASLGALRSMGATLIPLELPQLPISSLSIILTAEAGAAFDDLTRSGKDDLMVRQIKNAWPNVFRLSRFIPAVEYIQANRIRHLLANSMAMMMDSIDLYLAPTFQGSNLLLTNLTGHPSVVLPNGFTPEGSPTSITLIGRLFDEGTLLAAAKKLQDVTGHHLKHPDLTTLTR